MADPERLERRTNFRGRGRAGRRVDLRYRALGQNASTWRTAVTENVGIGGAFVVSEQPDAVGTMLEVELWIPTSDQPICVRGEVRWLAMGDGRLPGMGLKFSALDVDALLALSEYFAALTDPLGTP